MATSANAILRGRNTKPPQNSVFTRSQIYSDIGPKRRPEGYISKAYTSAIGPLSRPKGWVSRDRLPSPGARRIKPCPKGWYFYEETGACRKLPGTPKRRRRSKSKKSKSRRRKSKSRRRKSKSRRRKSKSRRKSKKKCKRGWYKSSKTKRCRKSGAKDKSGRVN